MDPPSLIVWRFAYGPFQLALLVSIATRPLGTNKSASQFQNNPYRAAEPDRHFKLASTWLLAPIGRFVLEGTQSKMRQ